MGTNNGLPEMTDLDKGLAEFLRGQGKFGNEILAEVELPGPDTSDVPVTDDRLRVRVFQIVEALRDARAPKLTLTPQGLDSTEVNLALQGMIDGLSLGVKEQALGVLAEGVDMDDLERKAEYSTGVLGSENWPEFRFGPQNGGPVVRRDELAVRVSMVQNMMWDRVKGSVLERYIELQREGRV